MVNEQGQKRRGIWIAILVVVALIVGTTAGFIVVNSRNSSAGASVTLEPADSIGQDPFTSSVAIGPVSPFPSHVHAVVVTTRNALHTNPNTHTLIAVGTAPGLYGGTGNAHVCDPAKLVTFLHDNPAKARAWASVFGISTQQIAGYVATLTPVVLTNDTLVTNHGYTNGHATTLQSVLQAGTAVMVDRTGTPRVKCNCGNPLTPPQAISLADATITGTPWSDYTPTTVAAVQPGATTHTITVINTTTGDTYPQPAGTGTTTTGTGQYVAAQTPLSGVGTEIVSSADGRSWSHAALIDDHPVDAIAFANGRWVAVANNDEPDSRIYESTDLQTWSFIGSVSGLMRSIAFGKGRWVLAGVQHPNPGSAQLEGVVYTSSTASRWSPVSLPTSMQTADDITVAFGDGHWLATAGHSTPTSGTTDVLTSSDGTSWRSLGARLGNGVEPALAFGAGLWVSTAPLPGAKNAVSVSTDGKTWSAARGVKFAVAVAYGSGSWLLAGDLETNHGAYLTTFYSSADGKTWSRGTTVQALVNTLAFGGAASAPAPAGGPQCTRAALQDVFSHETDDDMDVAILDAPDAPQCAGGWAVANYINQGSPTSAVFRANAGVWTKAGGSRQSSPGDPGFNGSFCSDPSFPAQLRARACY
jgi:hypothetical protein